MCKESCPISGCDAAAEAGPAEDPLVWCGRTATWLIGNLVLALWKATWGTKGLLRQTGSRTTTP